MGTTEWVWLIAHLVVGAALLARWRTKRWRPAEWARDLGIELTPRNEDFIRSYLTRTRVLRTVGAVAGLAAAVVYTSVAGEAPPEPFDFGLFNGLVGYLLGAVAAEVTFPRPRAAVPTASLEPRDVSAYLPTPLRSALRISAAVGIVLIPLFLVLPSREGDVARIDMVPAIVLVPVILVVFGGVELLQRYIVARPQPVDADLLSADDAVRSASVHALAGAGIALELVIVSVELAAIGFVSDIQILRWTVPWLALLTFVSSLASWINVTRPSRWHVLRQPYGAAA